ncbi:MAG TPA: gluconokinase [Nocardioidaceae bacterium]|nr:gluconokinase [Nocardioidaceae bacterium]
MTTGEGPVVLVLMGVSGCGKTAVGRVLASQLGWAFQEGDALHPPANVEKMAAGHPLTDEDRWPWLDLVAGWIDERLDSGQSGIVTCSALRRVYREKLDRRGSGVLFVYLAGDYDLVAARITARHGHYMPPSLLESQFSTLEEPAADEPAIRVEIAGTPREIADRIIERLDLAAPAEGLGS